MMSVELIKAPKGSDWYEVKRRALVTVGKKSKEDSDFGWKPIEEAKKEEARFSRWKHRILAARHSPIRYLVYSFALHDVPTWVATHLVRHHEGFQAYVKSQRNDRQKAYDRNAARQDAPVDMIIDINAEALQVLANKRLCMVSLREV